MACGAASPNAVSDSDPAQPERMVSGAQPAEAGAPTATGVVVVPQPGLTEIGTRSVRPRRLVSVMEPNVHAPNAAVVRVIVSLTARVCPGLIVKAGVSATAVVPGGACTVTDQRTAARSIDVNVRV